MEFQVEDDPDPLDIGFLETQIRREASAAMELGDEVELAIFVRDAGKVVAGISGWTWGDCCELQSLWVEPRLRGRWLGPRLLAAAGDVHNPDVVQRRTSRSRARAEAPCGRGSRGGGARVHPSRPVHLRFPVSSPV